MLRHRGKIGLYAAILLALVSLASGAQRSARGPQIGYAYPAGGQQGSTFEMRLAGRYLDGVSEAVVSGGGITSEVVEHVKPLNGKELNLLRDRLKELQARIAPPKKDQQADTDPPTTSSLSKTERDAAQKEIAEIKRKLANPKNRNRDNPQLGEDVVLRVRVSTEATPGRHELRLKTTRGLTNPVVFYVGQLPEYNETENDNDKKTDDPEPVSSIPVVINGQIMPGDVDRFTLDLKKDCNLVMTVKARDLIPYLADAVPGWFQATLALCDANGTEVAYVDDYRFNPDPVLLCKVPCDGRYTLEIKDAIYRGREDFVYRISLGELPFVTGIFPLGGRVGDTATVKLTGWNLPGKQLTLDTKANQPGVLPVTVKKGGFTSNTVPFALDSLPECLEADGNDDPDNAQKVALPIIINGRIEQPDDWDVYCFEGRAGQEIVTEVDARRLNSPLDSILKLTDATGKNIATDNDHEDRASGLTTHHADSCICTTLPADGTYYLHLGDAQHKGSLAHAYRLRISEPRPDFELRIVPSSINVRAGASTPISVYVLRKDGFSGDIRLSLKDAPKGFILNGGRIPIDKEMVKITLKAPPMRINEPVSLHIEGRSEVQGRTIVRTAIPAEDMMQAFIYRHLVPIDDLQVAVLPRPAARPNQNRRPNAATTQQKNNQPK